MSRFTLKVLSLNLLWQQQQKIWNFTHICMFIYIHTYRYIHTCTYLYSFISDCSLSCWLFSDNYTFLRLVYIHTIYAFTYINMCVCVENTSIDYLLQNSYYFYFVRYSKLTQFLIIYRRSIATSALFWIQAHNNSKKKKLFVYYSNVSVLNKT